MTEYEQPLAVKYTRRFLTVVYFVLFSLTMARVNGFSSVWLSFFVATAFMGLLGISMRYANPFKVRRSTSRGFKPIISNAAIDAYAAIALLTR